MRVRWFWYLGLVACLAIGSLWRQVWGSAKSPAPSLPAWLTTIDLAPNARVSTNYLKRSECSSPAKAWGLSELTELEGKYVLREIRSGGEVKLSNLNSIPQLVPPPGEALMFYPAPDASAAMAQGYLNAGTRVLLFETNRSTGLGPYVVEAVLGKTEPLTLALRVPTNQAADLHLLTKPSIRVFSSR